VNSAAIRKYLQNLSLCRELTGYDYKVILYMLSIRDSGYLIPILQIEIARQIGMSTGHIGRSVTKLENLGFLVRKRVGNRVCIVINEPEFYQGGI